MKKALHWSPQQAHALSALRDWWRKNTRQIFGLFGYAGTGKTELARAFGHSIGDVQFAAPTGKAADVLRKRGCLPVSTIHKLIYRTTRDPNTRTFRHELRPRQELAEFDAFIIDEASMIDAEVAHDLLSFEKKTLIVIDPGQLPPVNSVGYFSYRKPDVMLTEIHRQARDNPILRLADDVRRGRPMWREGRYGGGRLIIAPFVWNADAPKFDTILVGINETRRLWNAKLRRELGFTRGTSDAPPQCGEVVVCNRNDYRVDEPVFNGQQWTIENVENLAFLRFPALTLDLAQGDQRTRVRVPVSDFLGDSEPIGPGPAFQRFDFGYALTVHKAQGSEWERVLLVNESGSFGYDARKWLYTGITRAKNHLTIIKAG
jgi:exodeoxyribonuclease-5